MKKAMTVAISMLLLVSLLAGCGGKPGPVTSADPGGTPAADKPASGGKASTPSESFTAYMEAKNLAYERLSAKIDENEELGLYGLTLLPFVMMDLTLIPITALVGDDAAGAAALSMLGMNGVEIDRAGDTFTITYTDNEGKKTVQTCSYDAATDSMQSSITDDTGKETMFFEYARTGKGYAAQYYAVSDDGTQVYTAFFNDTDMAAFGIKATEEKPASIYKNGSVTVDFVKGADTFIMLDGDKLTVHDDGEDKTYE